MLENVSSSNTVPEKKHQDIPTILKVAQQTSINKVQVATVLRLLFEEQQTVPFIARYRKEMTAGLDEVQIRAVQTSYEELIELEKRRAFVLDAIAKMEQLTPDLKKKIEMAETINILEDLYAPYKAKKKSKGMMAKEAGLLPLAQLIQETPLNYNDLQKEVGDRFNNPEHKIDTFATAFEKALDIIIEDIAHDTELKDILRSDFWKEALLTSEKKSDAPENEETNKYQDYFEFKQKIGELKNPKVAHRVLAIRRGMTEKILKVDVTYPEELSLGLYAKKYVPREKKLGQKEVLEKCVKKAYNNSILPSLDLEIKTELKQLADDGAIDVFSTNLKNLLLMPYLGPKAVLGVDPGVRTGCKLAIVDNTGKYLFDTVIYPHPPQMEKEQSRKMVELLLEKFPIANIAIGNGTFGRETLEFFETMVGPVKKGTVKATLVSEAGASIYSASDIGREEFPDKDPTVRGAISIARRFQDPLAELVKIDPKSIGVGQYQHDVNQAKLKKSLHSVVESCVNYVGVDLNTASAPLLSYVAGIGPGLSQNIVKFRQENGIFTSREKLLKIPRFSQKIYEQCAGFLRIYNGEQPLDATFIHPERYNILQSWCQSQGHDLKELHSNPQLVEKLKSDKKLLAEIGEYTLNDIVKALLAPSQDPRTEFKSTEFRKDTTSINELKINEWYPGVVTNITQFGAFVDIGLKENGLLHVSEMADRFIENPLELFKVGQPIKVRVSSVDLARKRISLSCKKEKNSDGSLPSGSGSKSPSNKKPMPQEKIHNNAFAALKGLKIK